MVRCVVSVEEGLAVVKVVCLGLVFIGSEEFLLFPELRILILLAK